MCMYVHLYLIWKKKKNAFWLIICCNTLMTDRIMKLWEYIITKILLCTDFFQEENNDYNFTAEYI